jgi:flagellar hook assembly protein FlgD
VGFDTVSPLGIYDGSGRLIRRLCVGNRLPGEYEVVWDGLDEKGNPVAPGDYQWPLANSASIKAQYVLCDAPPASPQLGRADSAGVGSGSVEM